jgi:hypothetical protein
LGSAKWQIEILLLVNSNEEYTKISILSFCEILSFLRRKNTMYFFLKIYNIVYSQIFFESFWNFEINSFEVSKEKKRLHLRFPFFSPLNLLNSFYISNLFCLVLCMTMKFSFITWWSSISLFLQMMPLLLPFA